MAQLSAIWPAFVEEWKGLIYQLTPRLKAGDLWTYREWEHDDGRDFSEVSGVPRLFSVEPPLRRLNVSRGTGTTQAEYESSMVVWYPHGGLWPLAMQDDFEAVASYIDSHQTSTITGVCYRIIERVQDTRSTLTPSDDGRWVMARFPILARLALSD